jgi:hypothetical protein
MQIKYTTYLPMVITVGHSCSMGTTAKQQTSWHGTIETSFFHCVSYRNKKYHICGHSLDTWEYRIYCSPVWGVSVYVCDLRINFDWFLISGNIVTVYMSRWFSSWVRKCKNYDNVVQRTWDMTTRSLVYIAIVEACMQAMYWQSEGPHDKHSLICCLYCTTHSPTTR